MLKRYIVQSDFVEYIKIWQYDTISHGGEIL